MCKKCARWKTDTLHTYWFLTALNNKCRRIPHFFLIERIIRIERNNRRFASFFLARMRTAVYLHWLQRAPSKNVWMCGWYHRWRHPAWYRAWGAAFQSIASDRRVTTYLLEVSAIYSHMAWTLFFMSSGGTPRVCISIESRLNLVLRACKSFKFN